MSRIFPIPPPLNAPAPSRLAAVWLLLLSPLCGAEHAYREGVVKALHSVTISSRVKELIRTIEVEEGQFVKEGQVLVNLESRQEKLALEQIALRISKAEFDFKAANNLLKQNISSRDDTLAKEVELKRLEVEKSIAETRLAERVIKAPLSGFVVRKLKESGEAVNEIEPILQINQTDHLLLLFYIPAALLPSIQLDQVLSTRYPELPLLPERKAKVHFIDPEVDSRSGLCRVRLLIDNADNAIKPGMRVQARFPSDTDALASTAAPRWSEAKPEPSGSNSPNLTQPKPPKP